MKNIFNEPELIKQFDAACNAAEHWGTSYYRDDVRTTVQELSQKLGQPTFDDNKGEDKTNFEWNLLTDAGVPFTVYDWKHYRPLSNTEYVDWHIGARNAEESRICKEALIHFISYGTEQ
jgi:hypothetical protein